MPDTVGTQTCQIGVYFTCSCHRCVHISVYRIQLARRRVKLVDILHAAVIGVCIFRFTAYSWHAANPYLIIDLRKLRYTHDMWTVVWDKTGYWSNLAAKMCIRSAAYFWANPLLIIPKMQFLTIRTVCDTWRRDKTGYVRIKFGKTQAGTTKVDHSWG